MNTKAPSADVLIRKPAREEAAAIATLHIRSWQSAYRGLLSDAYLSGLDASLERRVAFLSHAIEAETIGIRVAERQGRIVGWGSFGPARNELADDGAGELMAIYLDPAAWGQGIGSALWSEVRKTLIAEGFLHVSAWVLDGNERARRFYIKSGFIAVEGSARTFEENGEPLPLTRYWLPLS